MWRQAQALANLFWRRFAKEYLPCLTERKVEREETFRNREETEKKQGDVVLVAKPNQPGGVWPLGRIVCTHPGQDGLVRAVTVRTQHREYKRLSARKRKI